MILESFNLPDFLRRFVALYVVLAMLLPTVSHATLVYTQSDQSYELMTLDSKEESEKEERQEDDTKHEKLEMQLLETDTGIYIFASEYTIIKPSDAASDYILEIPIPPPECN